jgi:hypothetical protein
MLHGLHPAVDSSYTDPAYGQLIVNQENNKCRQIMINGCDASQVVPRHCQENDPR